MQGTDGEETSKKQSAIQKKMKFYINYFPSSSRPSTKEKRKMICKKYREKKKNYILNLKNEITNLQTRIQRKQKQSQQTMLNVLNDIILLRAELASVNIQKELLSTSNESSSLYINIENDTMKETTLLEQTQIFSLYKTISTIQKQAIERLLSFNRSDRIERAFTKRDIMFYILVLNLLKNISKYIEMIDNVNNVDFNLTQSNTDI